MIIRDADGVQVLELGDTGYVGGYLVTDYDDAQRTWRRETTSAPFVDGEEDVAAALSRVWLTLEVEVDGSSVAEVRSRRNALLAAVEVPVWVLDVDGSVLWSCAHADSTSARRRDAPSTFARTVTLRIPAQPRFGY